MRNAWSGWIVLCALLATSGCRSSPPTWDGTWKLNPSKSNFQGPVFTLSISKDGEYRFDGGASSFTVRCDGRYRSIGKSRTQSCVRSSPTTVDVTRKENGVRTNTSHWELSAGGEVLVVTTAAFRSSGPVIVTRTVASRISGSNGFAGQWRDTTDLQRHAEITLRLNRQTLHIRYPNTGEYIDVPLDGVDTMMSGPHAPRGLTYAVRPAGQREFLILTKRNGKVLTQESLKLSSDGTVVTETWSTLSRPNDKGRLVYEKE
jgi:hypothetical protein